MYCFVSSISSCSVSLLPFLTCYPYFPVCMVMQCSCDVILHHHTVFPAFLMFGSDMCGF